MTSTNAGSQAGAPPAGPGQAGQPVPAHEHHTPYRWWVLGIIGLAQLMVVLDATIVNIALPSAQKDLGFDNDGRQWVITAYSLAFGSLLLLGGRLADLFGRKVTLLIGLVGFAVASALAGAADNFTMLVTGRALQGMFGSVLAPSALSLLTTTFTDAKERARAFGVFGAIAGSGGAIGLLLGGVLTEHLNWRWTLYVNLVIAFIAVAGALIFIRHPAPATRPRLDLFGTVLVAGGVFCIVFGFSSAETHSWSHWMCWGFLAAAVVLLLAFALWQSRARHPLLPLRVLRDRNRSASILSVFVAGSGMFGVFLFLTYYLQQTLDFSPIRTGLAFLPMVGMLMVIAQIAVNLLVPKLGPKIVVPFGMLCAAGGLFWLTFLDLHSSYATHVLPPLLVMGFGLGMVMPPAISLATLGVDRHDQGVASATVNTMQQVGGSIGTALFNTMAATAVSNYLENRRPTPTNQAEASLHSYDTAYLWAMGFFLTGMVITVLLYRTGRPARGDPAAAELPDDEGQQYATVGDTTQQPEPEGPAVAHTAGAHPAPAGQGAVGHGAASAVPSANGAVGGRVLDAAGNPVPNAAVTLIDTTGRQLSRTTAALDGAFTMDSPGEGSYVLVGSAPGHQPRVVSLTVDGSPPGSDLVLSGTGGLYGTVYAAGEPVSGALVVATDVRGEVVEAATSGAGGGYELPTLPPGSYTLTASAAGYQPYAGPVEVSGAAQSRHDPQLRAAATLRGTVRNESGQPVSNARVSLLDASGNVVAVRTTGEDGAYAFPDLAEAEYTVIASGYPPAATPLRVEGEGRTGFDIWLEHGD